MQKATIKAIQEADGDPLGEDEPTAMTGLSKAAEEQRKHLKILKIGSRVNLSREPEKLQMVDNNSARGRTCGRQRVRCLPLRCTLLVHQHAPMCPTTPLTYGRGCLLPTFPGHCEFCKYLPDAGCVGLAANGSGPRRCTAGYDPCLVRTQDRKPEARTGPRSLALLQWQTTAELPRCDLTTNKLATHEKTR